MSQFPALLEIVKHYLNTNPFAFLLVLVIALPPVHGNPLSKHPNACQPLRHLIKSNPITNACQILAFLPAKQSGFLEYLNYRDLIVGGYFILCLNKGCYEICENKN